MGSKWWTEVIRRCPLNRACNPRAGRRWAQNTTTCLPTYPTWPPYCSRTWRSQKTVVHPHQVGRSRTPSSEYRVRDPWKPKRHSPPSIDRLKSGWSWKTADPQLRNGRDPCGTRSLKSFHTYKCALSGLSTISSSTKIGESEWCWTPQTVECSNATKVF